MRTQSKRLVVSIAIVVAAGVTACGGGAGNGGAGADQQDSRSGNSAEQAFLSAMVPHHRSAIEMGEAAEGRLANREIRKIQAAIMSAQTTEIRQMERIHERLFGQPLRADEGAHMQLGLSAQEAGMDHMMGMQSIQRARPPVDRAFIDEMVPHHRGAVAMAETVLPRTRDPELRRLAAAIVSAQEEEIAKMERVRERELGGASPTRQPAGPGTG